MPLKEIEIVTKFKELFIQRIKDHKNNGGCRLIGCSCAYCIMDELNEIFKSENKNFETDMESL